MKMNIKSIFERPEPGDGYRILVDRFIPERLDVNGAGIDIWMRDIAPGEGIMKKYGHLAQSWGEFECAYFGELDAKIGLIDLIYNQAKRGAVTLLYSSHDEEHNPARAVKEYILTNRQKIMKRAA